MATLPDQMRQIDLPSPGGPDSMRISRGPLPSPRAGEILIRVKAAGVNRPDVLQRKGVYPPPPGASPILGLEVAGTVAALGDGVKQWQIDDAVCALVSGGGYAEYCVAPVEQCLPVPKGFTPEHAAAIPETFFTVWSNVFMRGRLASGESILVHGGSSGIGTTAIQLARAAGAHVFVTAGSDAKCQACIALGAAGAVNYSSQDFVHQVRRMNDGRGVDLILDMVGGDYFSRNVELLAPEGRLVQIAFQKGEQVELSLRALMSKGATVTGSQLRPRTAVQKGRIASELKQRVWPWLESGQVRVVMDQVFPLERAADAHRRMEGGEHIGKIVLSI